MMPATCLKLILMILCIFHAALPHVRTEVVEDPSYQIASVSVAAVAFLTIMIGRRGRSKGPGR